MRYKIEIEYDGSRFSGWQLQKNSVTIQGNIEEAFLTITGNSVRIHGAGRTDAGVHARGQVAHFDLENGITDLDGFCRSLNALTDRAIAIKSVQAVDGDFHARFSATSRKYRYYICQKNIAIGADYCWHNTVELNDIKIKEFCNLIKNEKDFTSFCKTDAGISNYLVQVFHVSWIKAENDIKIFEIESNRFLYGMVRTLVGTLIKVGNGSLEIDDIKKIFALKDRSSAPMAAPAKGLILEKVNYN